jgi:hypothetical protein
MILLILRRRFAAEVWDDTSLQIGPGRIAEGAGGAQPCAHAGWFEKLRGEPVESRERVERDV